MSIVYVVDDDISVRESLEPLIRSAGWQTEAFESATAFLAHGRPNAPCCVVLDVSLPDLNGLDVQKYIDMPIVFITGHGDIPMSVKAMKAGAIEFLTKPFDADHLVAAIGEALQRDELVQPLRDRYASLTQRERDVMARVVAGRLNKQVGNDLGISEITVKAHRGKVMQKMHAHSLAHLVTMATVLGLVQQIG